MFLSVLVFAILVIRVCNARPALGKPRDESRIAANRKDPRNRCGYEVWPLPSSIKCTERGQSAAVSADSFKIVFNPDSECQSSQTLVDAIARYQSLIFEQPLRQSRGVVAPEFTYEQTDDTLSTPDIEGSSRGRNSSRSSINPPEPMSSIAALEISIGATNGGDNDNACSQQSGGFKQLDDDESYSLRVDAEQGLAMLSAATQWGAMYGLETFSQLFSNELIVGGLPLAIDDAPRYPWRGLLLDTANHYLSMSAILRTVDGLAATKMNTLHWHIVDSYSFPYLSSAYPEIAQSGAWGAADEKLVYTPKDVEHVVAYANARGVRAVVEMDVPGHGFSWGLSNKYREIICECPRYTDELGHVDDVPLDVSKEQTYAVVQGLLSEFARLFPDKYIHIGGDEVKFGCWAESASINAFMEEKGIAAGDYYSLEQYFFEQIRDMGVDSLGKKLVAWEEVFFSDSGGDNGAHGAWVGSDALPKESTVIEIWTGADYLATALDNGYDALMAYGWYLDRQNPVDGEGAWFWGDTWAQMYGVDPEPLGPEKGELAVDEQGQRGTRGRALGGDASIWTEMTDAWGLDVAVWPRAAAVAERLWSPRDVKAANFAAPRLAAWRCRLAARYGIRAHPIWSDFCSAIDGM